MIKDSEMIFIFTNFDHDIERTVTCLKNDSKMLTIGKNSFDDIFNLLFIVERFRDNVFLVTINKEIDDEHQKLFSVANNSKLFLNRLLNESGSIANRQNFIANSFERLILNYFISIKKFFLNRKLKRRYRSNKISRCTI